MFNFKKCPKFSCSTFNPYYIYFGQDIFNSMIFKRNFSVIFKLLS